jgi:geranylgeranyl diphosphate synthase type I
MKVARYKSGKYSIERPLHFGAALSDKSELFSAFSGYGLPLGEAFQLRDDLLGVFGDPAVTGKPAGDDLREGKRTVLIAMTMERINDAQRKTLELALGNPSISEAEIQELQSLIENSGAREQVEKLITELTDKAISVLRETSNGSTINTNVADALEQMAIIATQRSL